MRWRLQRCWAARLCFRHCGVGWIATGHHMLARCLAPTLLCPFSVQQTMSWTWRVRCRRLTHNAPSPPYKPPSPSPPHNAPLPPTLALVPHALLWHYLRQYCVSLLCTLALHLATAYVLLSPGKTLCVTTNNKNNNDKNKNNPWPAITQVDWPATWSPWRSMGPTLTSGSHHSSVPRRYQLLCWQVQHASWCVPREKDTALSLMHPAQLTVIRCSCRRG